MNYVGITKNDIANGLGVRVVLWVAGCDIYCPHCHNPETHSFYAGEPFTPAVLCELYKAMDHDYIKGLTLSGGHPLDRNNIQLCTEILEFVKTAFPSKDTWVYTGYRMDDILNCKYGHGLKQSFEQMLPYIDYLVDGEYDHTKRDTTLALRGRSNQRILHKKEPGLWEEIEL